MASRTFDHPNLAVERAASTFAETDMTNFLNGSEAETLVQKVIMEELEFLKAKEAAGTPIELDGGAQLLDPAGIMPNEDHTLEESRLQTMKMLRFQYDRLFNHEDGSARMRRARMELMSLFDPAWFTRNGVHFGLWGGAIMGQGDGEQTGEWYGRTVSMEIFGCFGMTEIGHGSFVRGLETTATYDPATRCFDVHTPRLEATKWWIGGAAKTATHCAVFAQLVMPDGSRPGVHTFVVPLRSLDDHSVLPGIRVGDCGAKFGRNGLDNGFIQFDHVQVPRENMLCK
jgi:acyl-CoA oxidase